MGGWYSCKFTALSSTLATFPQLGHLPFSTLNMNYVIFFPFLQLSVFPLLHYILRTYLAHDLLLSFENTNMKLATP